MWLLRKWLATVMWLEQHHHHHLAHLVLRLGIRRFRHALQRKCDNELSSVHDDRD